MQYLFLHHRPLDHLHRPLLVLLTEAGPIQEDLGVVVIAMGTITLEVLVTSIRITMLEGKSGVEGMVTPRAGTISPGVDQLRVGQTGDLINRGPTSRG